MKDTPQEVAEVQDTATTQELTKEIIEQVKKQQEEEKQKAEKKVQMSISILKELANDAELLIKFIEIITQEEEVKTPMAIQMARREVKQQKLKM